MLVGKDQNRVTIKGRLDFCAVFARQGARQVDIAQLGRKTIGYRVNSHWYPPLLLEVSGKYIGSGVGHSETRSFSNGRKSRRSPTKAHFALQARDWAANSFGRNSRSGGTVQC